ncbi:MAG: hypothetical protein AAF492_20370 [Verrucomicrobiota bacterium]
MGFENLDTPSTLVMGLAYGGMTLLGLVPFLLMLVAVIRFYKNKRA